MVRQRTSEYYAATDTTGDQAEERNGRPGYFCHVLLACCGRAERTLRRPLWFPKTSSADRIDAKRAGERRLAEGRRTRPGREFGFVPMEIAIRIRSSLSHPDAPYHRGDDSPCDGGERGYATRM